MWLALLTAMSQCLLMISLLSDSTSRSLSVVLFFSTLFPILYLFNITLLQMQKSQLIFMPVTIINYSNVSRYPCKDFHPSKESTPPPNIESSAPLLKMYSRLASKPPIIAWNGTCLRIKPWGYHSSQPDVAPFTQWPFKLCCSASSSFC